MSDLSMFPLVVQIYRILVYQLYSLYSLVHFPLALIISRERPEDGWKKEKDFLTEEWVLYMILVYRFYSSVCKQACERTPFVRGMDLVLLFYSYSSQLFSTKTNPEMEIQPSFHFIC